MEAKSRDYGKKRKKRVNEIIKNECVINVC
jgi:hypothetical protein